MNSPDVRRLLSIWSCAVLVSVPVPRHARGAEPQVELRNGDHICIVGNTLAERMQFYPHLEVLLHANFPRHDLVIRNLGWSADEIELRPRSLNFGTPDDYLTQHAADVIWAFFGFNEAFQGLDGLPGFRSDLTAWVRHVRSHRYNGTDPPRLVLFSPIELDRASPTGMPRDATFEASLKHYSATLSEVARAEKVGFVDLTGTSRDEEAAAERRTINGIHLTDVGYRQLAPLMFERLIGRPAAVPTPEAYRDLYDEVLTKNRCFWHNYRAVNGYYIYGGRSDLHNNRAVLEAERTRLEQMATIHDERIWSLARGKSLDGPADYSATPSLPTVTSNVTEPITYLSPAESKNRMRLASGYAVECFASEEDFPELANPVALAFDGRGRLWVLVMPTYPQLRPPEPPRDKLLILEDTNHDGRADRCTTFADGLHVPTGFELGDGGAYVAEQPNLLFLRDQDGDDRADTREILLHGFDSADSHHSISAFAWGPEGGLYFQEGTFHHSQIETPYGPVRCKDAGVFRYEPGTHRLRVFASYPFANPWGHTFDDWGQSFINDASGGASYFGTAMSGDLDYPRKHASLPLMIPFRVRPTSGHEFVSSRHFPDEAQGRLLIN
ncbi:MAG TPA: PVC-type heme-binding CxxCH protein, partial [Pirellulaceae bacterium]